MAHYRAVIKGARGEASRLGHKATGISTLLQTWGWDVRVSASYEEAPNRPSALLRPADTALIELVNHNTGQCIPLLNLNLSAVDPDAAVEYIYRTVDEKTSAATLARQEA